MQPLPKLDAQWAVGIVGVAGLLPGINLGCRDLPLAMSG